jgi:uncharacterized glyoxalase superfamily protein PhnB
MEAAVGAVYVVTGAVDGVFAAVQAPGVDILEKLHDTDYGSHTFTTMDMEGDLWTFGTYRSAA